MKTFLKISGISLGTILLGLIIISGVLLQDGFKNVSFTPFPLPEQTRQTWDNVFDQPAPISVKAFRTGTLHFDRYIDNPPDAEDRYAPSDVIVYWLRHAQHGDILIDAGFDRSFSLDQPLGNLPVAVKVFLTLSGLDKLKQEPGQALDTILQQYQLLPRYVFFTHLHFDHTAGTPALPQESVYVCDVREMTFITKAAELNSHFKQITQFASLDFTAAIPMSPFERCLDLFGDGSLWAISTPGHSAGHVSFLVNTHSGPVLITGDAAFYYWGFAQGIGSKMFDADPELARRSRAQLAAFVEQYPRTQIFVGHELRTAQ
jgi:glyoxylase-like metal-dependent hydrolase (beta-lactamase superfamily II)